MFDFLLTSEGQKVVAFVTVAIIALAFFFKLHPLKKRTPKSPSAYWTARQYYIHLYACVFTCTTKEELYKIKPLIVGFLEKEFQQNVSRKERTMYYADLMKHFKEKELSLTETFTNPVVCQN